MLVVGLVVDVAVSCDIGVGIASRVEVNAVEVEAATGTGVLLANSAEDIKIEDVDVTEAKGVKPAVTQTVSITSVVCVVTSHSVTTTRPRLLMTGAAETKLAKMMSRATLVEERIFESCATKLADEFENVVTQQQCLKC